MAKYVDADAVFDLYNNYYGNIGTFSKLYVEWLKRVLTEMPVVDVQEVRRGQWVKRSLTPYCSICHKPSEYECDGTHSMPPFCPHCGAKMDGGEK